jgi:hypothetical protein
MNYSWNQRLGERSHAIYVPAEWTRDLPHRQASQMKLPQYNLSELLLVVVFVGLFVALAARTLGGFFFIQGLVTAAVLLLMTYLLLMLMIRQHRSR